MHKTISLFILLAVVLGATSAMARGGRDDDCPAGSTDPDCIAASKTSPSGK